MTANIENILLVVILQLVVIIAASRVFGNIFRRMGQPQVCGEIAAGLILGPSLLGGMFPGLFGRIFDPSVGPVLTIMSQLGLVLLTFLIGLEFDFGHLQDRRRAAVSISLAGIVLPFGLGFLLGHYLHGQLGLASNWVHFALFVATAMSITAIPVLGRIMIELGINRTRIGSLTISAAAIDDATGWILLALVTASVKSAFDPVKTLGMAAATGVFAWIMVVAVRPRLIRWSRGAMTSSGGLSLNGLAVLLIFILLAAAATNLIGIFSVFGAFFLGAVLHDQVEFTAAIKSRLSDFVTVFFLPIFFTYTGLRTDIGTMSGGWMWGLCGLVLLVAVTGKFGGCTLAAKFSGLRWRESAMVGVMMNTRGLMELIVINIGYDLGIIPKSVFFMLVFMAIFTTYITTPILQRLMRGSEVEEEYKRSEFARV